MKLYAALRYSVRQRLGNDGAKEGLFGALFALALNHPNQALELLVRWTSTRPDKQVSEMASLLLGRLRASIPTLTEELDNTLRTHLDEERRVVFHQSWGVYDRFRPIEASKYEELIVRMGQGTPAEIEEGIDLICSTLLADHREDVACCFGCRWLQEHIRSGYGTTKGYTIIQLAIHGDKRTAQLKLPPFRDLIPLYCPIPKNDQATWYSVKKLLIGLLMHDRQAFEQLLYSMARVDLHGLLDRFSSEGSFGELAILLSQEGTSDLITNALSSLEESLRLLGICLFKHLHLDSLPEAIVDRWTDEWIAVLIYQNQLGSLFDEKDARFLRALLPRIHRGGEELKSFFIDELVWQMKNLPGMALEAMKAHAVETGDTLLHEAIEKTEKYFNDLTRCSLSPINSMQVGGYRLAERIRRRRWSKQMSDVADDSPILGLVSKSYCLYGGNQWQTYFGEGTLQPPQSMSEFSHKMELARLPFIDPDGYAQRRRRAWRHINELVTEEAQSRGGTTE